MKHIWELKSNVLRCGNQPVSHKIVILRLTVKHLYMNIIKTSLRDTLKWDNGYPSSCAGQVLFQPLSPVKKRTELKMSSDLTCCCVINHIINIGSYSECIHTFVIFTFNNAKEKESTSIREKAQWISPPSSPLPQGVGVSPLTSKHLKCEDKLSI